MESLAPHCSRTEGWGWSLSRLTVVGKDATRDLREEVAGSDGAEQHASLRDVDVEVGGHEDEQWAEHVALS